MRLAMLSVRCSEILLVDGTGMIDHEGHDAGISVLGGVCDQPEAADHLPLDDVVQSSARRVGSLALQNSIIIAMIGRRLLSDLVPFGRCLRRQFAERARVAIVAPEQPILLARATDDALCVGPHSLASAILFGVFVLGIDVSQRGLNSVQFIASDATIQNLETPGSRVELPASPVVHQRNRERKIVRAQDERSLLVSLGLDGMFGVIGGQETLAHFGIGNVIAGLDNVLGILAEDLQNGAPRPGLDRGSQRRRSVLRRGIGLLRLGRRGQQRHCHDCTEAHRSRATERIEHDHGNASGRVGIFAPPASQSL